ncbi:hypothetical protein BD311DRAFT_133862 [Dichomitus squalens]|uniref:Uncharacterized protein n=1 Tax=Dichomitus squalens TaxID=114155 RepID=A0A4Q9MVI8_9APHY|nr:hypothetical protein BD311DRAFT_133862 [Dichomitus squalens]
MSACSLEVAYAVWLSQSTHGRFRHTDSSTRDFHTMACLYIFRLVPWLSQLVSRCHACSQCSEQGSREQYPQVHDTGLLWHGHLSGRLHEACHNTSSHGCAVREPAIPGNGCCWTYHRSCGGDLAE